MALRRLLAAAVTTAIAVTPLLAFNGRAPTRDVAHAPSAATLTGVPLAFEPNAERGDARVRYLTRGPGYTLGLRSDGVTLAFERSTLRMRLAGSRPSEPRAEDKLRGVVNDYRGGRANWRTNIPTFGRIRYPGVYPGIDAVYHGRDGRLEYDFEIAPGADPRQIAVRFEGAKGLRLARGGALLIQGPHGVLRQERPLAFQDAGGTRTRVDVRYRVSDGRIGFALGPYDRSRPLLIDPSVGYATYLGGSGSDRALDVATGPDGSVYVVGNTGSNDFPGATPRTGARADDGDDFFVTRLDATGTTRLFTTYLGGGGFDEARDIAVDSSGRSYVVGRSAWSVSEPYPEVSPTPGDRLACEHGGQTGVITRLTTSGTVGYSTCWGGNIAELPYSVALHEAGGGVVRAYVAGSTDSSVTLPLTGSAYQGTRVGATAAIFFSLVFGNSSSCPGAVAECESLQYGTLLDQSSLDEALSVAADPSGAAYLALRSYSPTLAGQTGPTTPSTGHAMVAKFDPTKSGAASLVYATWFVGATGTDGGDTWAESIRVTNGGVAYIAGHTKSTLLPNIDSSSNLTGSPSGINEEAFLGRVSAAGTPDKTVVFGGSGPDYLFDLSLQEAGGHTALYGVGATSSSLTEILGVGDGCPSTGQRALAVKADFDATPIGSYLTCIGTGNIQAALGVATYGPATWITGYTDNNGIATSDDAIQPNFGTGAQDAFLAKVEQRIPDIDSGPDNGSVLGTNNVTFTFSSPEPGFTFECSSPVGGVLAASPRSQGACTGNGTAGYSGLADGQHQFGVATVALTGGTISRPRTRSFTVDTSPPSSFDLTAPEDGGSTSSTPTFSWTQPSDLTTVSYELFIDDQKVQDLPPSACNGGTCSATATVSSGPHSWKVAAIDAAGNRRESGPRSFSWPDPPTAAFSIAPNPVLVGRTVTFDGSLSKPASRPIARYEWDLDGNGSYETDGGGAPTVARTYPVVGTFTIRLRVSDGVGQTSTAEQQLRVADSGTGARTVGVSVNKGAQYTNKPDVTLTIVAPTGATGLLVANDGGFAGTLPVPLSAELPWKLDSSGPERLPKTVYVRFLTGTFSSPNYTDDIILDERPPVVNSASIAGAAAAARAVASKAKTWKVKVRATDTNSGVGFVQVTTNKRRPGKLIKYSRTVKAKSSTRPKFLRARDRAGNFSKWRKLR